MGGSSYTYDLKGRPLTMTYGGATYWYVYNAHGDVVALTDSTGAMKARYEYDEWGRLEAMYDENGRVKEGYGTIGDIGTGPTRPVIGSQTPGGSGKGKGNKAGGTTTQTDPTVTDPTAIDTATQDSGEVQIQGVIADPTELVQANPYRWAGYRYDRETQYYYLQQRYYEGRLGRFLSQDKWAGDVRTPLTLNKYLYAIDNPVNYGDKTGNMVMFSVFDGCSSLTGDGCSTPGTLTVPDLNAEANQDVTDSVAAASGQSAESLGKKALHFADKVFGISNIGDKCSGGWSWKCALAIGSTTLRVAGAVAIVAAAVVAAPVVASVVTGAVAAGTGAAGVAAGLTAATMTSASFAVSSGILATAGLGGAAAYEYAREEGKSTSDAIAEGLGGGLEAAGFDLVMLGAGYLGSKLLKQRATPPPEPATQAAVETSQVVAAETTPSTTQPAGGGSTGSNPSTGRSPYAYGDMYSDGTKIRKGEEPPKLPGGPRGPLPDPEAQGRPHTRIRWDVTNGRVYQGREFGENGRPIVDIDFTAPLDKRGEPFANHELPHAHPWKESGGGWTREAPISLPNSVPGGSH